MQRKILTVLFGVVLLNGLLAWGIQRLVVFPSYLDLERAEADRNLERCLEALGREIHHLSGLAHDWAAWDDTYRFVGEPYPEYVESNLVTQTFTDNRLNLLFFFDLRGRVVWGQVRELPEGTPARLPEFPDGGLPPDHPLFRLDDGADAAAEGVSMTARGPMLVASRPVTTSDHQGAIRGYLIMGRLMTPAFVRQLAEQTRVPHEYIPLDSAADEWDRRAASRMADGARRLLIPVSDHRLRAYALVPDLAGDPLLLVRAEISRDIRARGAATLRYALVFTVGAGVAILLASLLLLRFIVVEPVRRLTERVESIGDDWAFAPPIFEKRGDEIGVLCRTFNRLLLRLREAHEGLRNTNERLEHEIGERRRSERELILHRTRLRALAAEVLMAEERERRRIATQVHDRIGQHLAVTRLKMGLLLKRRSSCCLLTELKELEGFVDQVIQDARSLTFEISPPILYEMGLPAAVEWLADEMAERHGLRLRFRNDLGTETLGESVRVMTFQVVRELVFNVVKHAGVDEAEVRLRWENGAVGVEARDAGAGFEVSERETRSNGFGLFSIRERMLSMGGSFELDTRPGGGTRVSLKIPVDPVTDLEDWR